MKKLYIIPYCRVYIQCISFIFLSAISFGQAGSLDRSFANQGKLLFNFTNENASFETGIKSFALPGDKVLVVFRTGQSFNVTRLLADGTVDPDYGNNGYADIIPINADNCAFQSDGKVVMVGSKRILTPGGGSVSAIALGRLTANGKMDHTFDQDGLLVLNDFPNENYDKTPVAVQADNKIIICNKRTVYSPAYLTYLLLMRLNADGSLDNGFGDNGVTLTSFQNYDNIPNINSILINYQQKVILAGEAYNGYLGIFKTYLVRYNSDGSIDNSYDSDGILVLNYNMPNNLYPSIKSATLQSEDTILLAGSVTVSTGYPYISNFFVARVTGDGSLDPAFNGTGYVMSDLGSWAYSVAVQQDGMVLLAGEKIARFDRNGLPDLSFGTNGSASPILNISTIQPGHITLNASEKIFVTGFAYGIGDAIVYKLNHNGTTDNSFSVDGFAQLFIEGSLSDCLAVFKKSNGNLLCVGTSQDNSYNTYMALASFLPDGSPDNSFNGNGKLLTPYAGGYSVNSNRVPVLMQSDEKILFSISPTSFIRLNTSGAPDPFFAAGGIATIPAIPGYTIFGIMKMTLQSDQKPLVLALVYPVDNYWNFSLAVYRFNQDGSIDGNFGVNGVQVLPAGYTIAGNGAFIYRGFYDAEIMMRTDGKIVIVGALLRESPSLYYVNPYLARLKTDGSFDETFDGDGVKISYADFSTDINAGICLPDHSIILGLYPGLMKFNEDGNLDAGFGNNGVAGSYDGITDFSLQADGKIVTSGWNVSFSLFTLSRFNANGTPDISFGNNGTVQGMDHFPENTFLNDIWVDGNKLFAAGRTQSPIQSALITVYNLSDVQLSCPADVTATTQLNQCSVAVNDIDPVLTPAGASATVNYTLTGATTGSGTGSVSGQSFNTGITTVSYTLADAPSQTCSFKVTVSYPVSPAITISSSDAANGFCNGILLTASSNVPVQSYSWSNGVSGQTNNLTTADTSGTYTVSAVAASGCPAIPAAHYNYNKENLASSYTLLATKSIKLQQNNRVLNGSVGVINNTGSFTAKKNVTINGNGAFVKAQNVSLQSPYNIPNIIYSPATVPLPAMQYNTTSTAGLSNENVGNNVTATISGNRRMVNIGRNSTVTLTGNVFGDISIGASSTVIFTQPSIDVASITMFGGVRGVSTKIRFSSDVTVRCSGNIQIDKNCVINLEDHQAVMYVGNTRGKAVSFTVAAGGNDTIYTSVYIPAGMISIGGDDVGNTTLYGKFIAEQIETLGKNVDWNWHVCNNPDPGFAGRNTAPLIAYSDNISVSGLALKAWPNPSSNQFTLNIESNSNDPVDLKIYDLSGRLVYSMSRLNKKQIQVGNILTSGTYIAEVRQGKEQSSVKLVKY